MEIVAFPVDFDGCGCYRILFPLKYLRMQGWNAGLFPHRKDHRDEKGAGNIEWLIFHGLPKADVYAFSMPRDKGLVRVALHAQREGVPFTVDLDDDQWHVPPYLASQQGLDPRVSPDYNRDHVRRAVQHADRVSVSTPALAEIAAEWSRDVTVVPNYLDWGMWRDIQPQYEVERARLRVGYMGDMRFHQADIRILQGWLGPWLEKHPEVDFVAAGDPTTHDILDVPYKQRVTIPGVAFNTMRLPELMQFDIGLVPLVRNRFNEAKSYLKGLEYAATGIPTIATPTEQYTGFIVEGETGFLANKPRKFIARLDQLVTDDGLRRRMGVSARERAREYTLDRHISEWAGFYQGTMRGQVAA